MFPEKIVTRTHFADHLITQFFFGYQDFEYISLYHNIVPFKLNIDGFRFLHELVHVSMETKW